MRIIIILCLALLLGCKAIVPIQKEIVEPDTLLTNAVVQRLIFTESEMGSEYKRAEFQEYDNPGCWVLTTASSGVKSRLQKVIASGVSTNTELCYTEYEKKGGNDIIVKLFLFESIAERELAEKSPYITSKNQQLVNGGLPGIIPFKNALYYITGSTSDEVAKIKELYTVMKQRLEK